METELGQFELRKKDHISHSLKDSVDARANGLDSVHLNHEALPELDFQDIDIAQEILGHKFSGPMFVSSMTAGHSGSESLNYSLAECCAEKNWLFAVGSQRRQLMEPGRSSEWSLIRRDFPGLKMLANIGLSQLVAASDTELINLVESLGAIGLIVHLNPLQEVIQLEGTPNFKGGLKRLSELSQNFPVPLVVKETGCGMTPSTLKKLDSTGVKVVDLAGFGGTHWGRIEGLRAETLKNQSIEAKRAYMAAKTFSDWGETSVSTLMATAHIKLNNKIWASGGVRTGLDVAKFLSMGAQAVGLARPVLIEAKKGKSSLLEFMEQLELELKIALFCTGSRTNTELSGKWKWIQKN